MTATLTATTDGKNVTATITDEAGSVVETITVKDNQRFISALDRELGVAGWNRGGFQSVNGVMVASATRPALWTLLNKVNAL